MLGRNIVLIDEWIEIGIKNNWVDKFCYYHDYPPLTDEEQASDEEGHDICVPTLRVYLN